MTPGSSPLFLLSLRREGLEDPHPSLIVAEGMPYLAAEFVFARTVAVGGHGGTGGGLVAGSGGSCDVFYLIACPLFVEVRAGVEDGYDLLGGHIDLQEKADQGKARTMGQVGAFGNFCEHLLDAGRKGSFLYLAQVHPIACSYSIELLFERPQVFLERGASLLVYGQR